MHIGVSAQGFVGWGGGVGFVENLLYGLLAVPDQVSKITVFVPEPPGPLRSLAARFKRAAVEPTKAAQHLFGPSPSLEPWHMAPTSFAKICPNVVTYDGSVTDVRRLCLRLRVDVLLPLTQPSDQYGVPWAGYLADCQHRYYPQLFDTEEIAARDRYFLEMLHTASIVMVNSRAAAADFSSFFPDQRASIVALPFAPLLRSENIASVAVQTPAVKQKYATGDKYLIISNQFWIHKDHGTAFKAFALATDKGILHDYKLVCTGTQEDFRFPDHFKKLEALLASLNIKDRVIFTGHIDKLNQLALINGATLMLQPTLFEGGPGGGAAYDSVSLGIPTILSDIPVNFEIADTIVTFFTAGDIYSLANAIELQIQRNVRRKNEYELAQRSNDYARKLGLSLFGIAREALHGLS